MMREEYSRTLEDEIDWKIIDQLHNATLNFSSKSLEFKKMLFVLIGIAVPTIVKLSEDKLDWSLFCTLYLLTLSFWILDSYTYYYQEKLRDMMNSRFKKISERNELKKIIFDNKISGFTLSSERSERKSIYHSFFNSSMALYVILLILNTFGAILFSCGAIK